MFDHWQRLGSSPVGGSYPIAFYAPSRLLWVALELRWWPLEPGELARPSPTAADGSVDGGDDRLGV